MEEQKEIMWNFLETAFRVGTLDELLDFINVVTGKNFEDMSQAFADLEDVFMEMENTSALEDKFAIFYRLLKELTNDEVLEGIGILLSLVNPLIESWIVRGGGGSPLTPEKQAELRNKIIKSARSLFALGALGSKMMMASLADKSPYQLGQSIGKALNTVVVNGNAIIAKDTPAASDFMAGVFSAVDRQGFGKLTNSLTDGFLDQRPPVFKWLMATTLKMARKRFRK